MESDVEAQELLPVQRKKISVSSNLLIATFPQEHSPWKDQNWYHSKVAEVGGTLHHQAS